MLRNVSKLIHYRLGARDGEIGRVRDFYFDDQNWVVRYLVADTGTWLTGRQVLISPYALTGISEVEKQVNVNLTRKQIEDSPSIDADKPLSRQYETDYHRYYGWPMYWYGPALWGAGPYPVYNGLVDDRINPEVLHREESYDPHLRSIREVAKYRIQAIDDELGHVEDFVLDDENWAIRYLEVDTRNWWPGKKVLMAPQWIREVSWDRAKVFVGLHKDTIKQAPEYDESSVITREYEARLYQHYNRETYWPATERERKPPEHLPNR